MGRLASGMSRLSALYMAFGRRISASGAFSFRRAFNAVARPDEADTVAPVSRRARLASAIVAPGALEQGLGDEEAEAEPAAGLAGVARPAVGDVGVAEPADDVRRKAGTVIDDGDRDGVARPSRAVTAMRALAKSTAFSTMLPSP